MLIMKNFVASYLLIFILERLNATLGAVVLHHPKSRLVPVNAKVSFTCTISGGVSPHWVIDENSLSSPYSITFFASKGFIVRKQEIADNIDTLTLTFVATGDRNGTTIYCQSQSTHSDDAVLLILNESPLLQNPTISNLNPSTVLLKWSPPFLWPGHSIDHYNISVSNTAANDTVFYRVNSTFHDVIVSFSKTSPTEVLCCNEMIFGITAVSESGSDLASFFVKGGYLPNNSNITSSGVNLNILFEQDRSPLVIVDVMLPETVCRYEHLNYSIYIEHDGIVVQYGPYEHYGSNPLYQTLSSGLREKRNYTLMVIVDTLTGTFYSEQHTFNTSLLHIDHCVHQHKTNYSVPDTPKIVDHHLYKVIMGIFVGLTVVLLLIAIMCSCVLCQRKRKRSTPVIHSTNRVFSALTNNPIYEGPVYDSIVQSHFDMLPSQTSEASAIGSGVNKTSCSDQPTVSDLDHGLESVMPDRYIKVSHHGSSNVNISTHLSLQAPHTEVNDRSQSPIITQQQGTETKIVSSPMYMKCMDKAPQTNEMEENKRAKVTRTGVPHVDEDEDNKYTVMTAIGMIKATLSGGSGGPGQ